MGVNVFSMFEKGKQGNLADRSFHFYPILSRLKLIRGICLMFELIHPATSKQTL